MFGLFGNEAEGFAKDGAEGGGLELVELQPLALVDVGGWGGGEECEGVAVDGDAVAEGAESLMGLGVG